jgi:hypothetical protein
MWQIIVILFAGASFFSARFRMKIGAGVADLVLAPFEHLSETTR